jgi:hypothetical protein
VRLRACVARRVGSSRRRVGSSRRRVGREHAVGRSYRIFRYNTFHHIGHISTLAQPTNRYNPGCYALMYDWLLPAEVFNAKDCPDDDLWPCTEAAAHRPAFFPDGRLVWSAKSAEASALAAEKAAVVGALDALRPLPVASVAPAEQHPAASAAAASASSPTSASSSSASAVYGGSDGADAPLAASGGHVSAVAAARGESCSAACARLRPGSRCDADELLALNNCDVLRTHFDGCTRGCERSEGTDQPARVADHAPDESRPGVCLFNGGLVACDGAHPLTQRLCACAKLRIAR